MDTLFTIITTIVIVLTVISIFVKRNNTTTDNYGAIDITKLSYEELVILLNKLQVEVSSGNTSYIPLVKAISNYIDTIIKKDKI